jgi:hypothetical protein
VSGLGAPFSLANFLAADESGTEGSEEVEEAMETGEAEEDKPVPRVTRSAARKSVTFAVDTEPQGKERRKAERKGGEKERPRAPALLATKKAFMKKIRKTKKKSAKQATSLATLVQDIAL